MNQNEQIVELIAAGNTLLGQKQLFALPPSATPAADEPLIALNRALLTPPDEANAERVQQAKEEHLARLPTARGAALALLQFNLGCIALYQDEVQEAQTRFGEVVKLDPDHRYARHNLAYTCELMADLSEARANYARIVHRPDDLALSRLNLALVRGEEGDASGCADGLRALHRRDPGNMGVLLYLCRALLANKTQADAQEVVDLLRPGKEWAEFLDLCECRAYALYVLGETEAAESAFRELLAAGEESLFARLGLIKALAAQGNFPALKEELERYQALNPPENLSAVLALARSL
jgi:tetratricopeptide (TPR) repeat protein